jgi:uncharacterized protein (TIGR02145 family)
MLINRQMKKAFSFLAAVVLTALIFTSCGSSSNQNEVQIGEQVWMTKNLDVSTFRNGDPILKAKTNEEWEKAGENRQPAWCYNTNNFNNIDKFGKLYNWYAVIDPRGLAPTGYHIPNNAEWAILIDYLGGEGLAGWKMKSTTGWGWCRNCNGINSNGFSGLPGGYRSDDGLIDGQYYPNQGFSLDGNWWSASELANVMAYRIKLVPGESYVRHSPEKKSFGFSVRCLKD